MVVAIENGYLQNVMVYLTQLLEISSIICGDVHFAKTASICKHPLKNISASFFMKLSQFENFHGLSLYSDYYILK